MQRTLDELPESLDETYERVLKEIKKPNRDHARRVLSCLVAAVRPLRVEELSEVLAVDYEDSEGIPRLNPNWRWEDEEQALLISCSSLIAIVEFRNSRVVQFSHFSVKEYLTSTRLATSRGDVLRHHIALEPAHMTLAQACMSALLRSNDRVEQNGVENSSSPLSKYAAEHWVVHAKYGNVTSYLRKAMEYLFDLDKPYFTTWLRFYDIDIFLFSGSTFNLFKGFRHVGTPRAGPLYYAALCGFQDLVEHLILKNPQHVNANGGSNRTPLVAALAEKHFQIARILRDNGAHPNIEGREGNTPLHSAVYYGRLQIVKVLLECKADVHAQNDSSETPLHRVPKYDPEDPNLFSLPDKVKIARYLLEHGADVNAHDKDQSTPLDIAAHIGMVEVARVLLEHRADVNARSKDYSTLLHRAARRGNVEVIRLLLEHRAYVNALDDDQSTPLHYAAQEVEVEVVLVLLEHMADVNARSKDHSTALHRAVQRGRVEVVRVLLEHRADVNALNDDHSSPLHIAAQEGEVDIARVLLEHGAIVDAEDEVGSTPFQLALLYERSDIMELLFEHSVKHGHVASYRRYIL